MEQVVDRVRGQEEMPVGAGSVEDTRHWEGNLFVFDDRFALYSGWSSKSTEKLGVRRTNL